MNLPFIVQFLIDMRSERTYQFSRWGVENHTSVNTVLANRPRGCTAQRMVENYEIPTAARARFLVEQAKDHGNITWAALLIEEVCEAIEAAVESGDGEQLQAELVQVATVAMAWSEFIERKVERPDPTRIVREWENPELT